MLSPKQERFCQEYAKLNEGKEAAIQAGYSKKTAEVKASQLLRIVKVKDRVAELKKKVADDCGIDAFWVAKRLQEVAERCMTAEPVMIKVDGVMVESGEYQFDSSGANRALELLGKHLGFFEKDNEQKNFIIQVNKPK